jgi:hypothetical protein
VSRELLSTTITSNRDIGALCRFADMRQRTSDELRAVVRADDDTYVLQRSDAARTHRRSCMIGRSIGRAIHAGNKPKRAIKGKQ